MKRIILLTAIVAALSLWAADRARETKLQQAIDLMGTKGDLPGAIKLLEDVAKSTDRNLAARSLLYLGDCREKLGQKESRATYERIVRDFADQKEVVAEARQRLAAMGGAPAGQQATRVVWTGDKVDTEGTISPDGRYISFPDWGTGNLALHDFVTGADRMLTNTGTWKSGEQAFAEESAISRDGKQVAYSWYSEKTDRYELCLASLAGSGLVQPRLLFDRQDVDWIGPYDWSPDGNWLAVELTRKDRSHEVGLVSTRDGSLRVLKSGTEYKGLGSFSQDGKYIVYTRGRGLDSRGYILSADGKSEIPLLSAPSSVQRPVWTPDGSRVVFVSDRSGSPGLWSVQVVDGKPADEPELLKAGFGDANWLMGFARDGLLFYEARTNQTDIYVAGLDPATGKLTSEPSRVNQRSIGNSWGRVAWLPDGKSLSYWGRRHERDALVVHTLDTGQERELWDHAPGAGNYPGYAGWFPDGRSLMSWERKGQKLVFRRVEGKTGEAQATWTIPDVPSTSTTGFVPSHDLMSIFFTRKDETVPCEGAMCTYIMLARDLETGRDREVLRLPSIALARATVSYDGRSLAFISNDRLSRALMIAPTGGGAPRELYRWADDFTFIGTTWTRDGDHVLALRRLPSGGEVWSFPIKGGQPEKSPVRVQPFEQPAVSADGTQIAFVAGRGKSELWVMTGLLPDAKPAAAR